MKSISILLILLSNLAFSQGSLNIELLDNWTDNGLVSSSTQVRYNDCWGYYDSNKDIEYAILGSTEGHHFFEVNNANKLIEIDFLKGKYIGFDVHHRDVKTYKNYAYMVCDEGNSSLQIVDLSFLPDSVHVVKEDTINFVRTHNIFIDSTNALLYACTVRSTSHVFSLQIYSLIDPENPQLVYTEPGNIAEVHDCYVRDNIAYLNCGFDGLRVYDFTSVSNPVFLQDLNIYQQQGYNHQGWMTPDGTKFIFGDETNGKKLKNCSVNTNHKVSIQNFFDRKAINGSVPHNIMADNNFAFVAYYNEGFRVFSLNQHIPKEVAYYDTYPEEHPFKMFGAWGVYSHLPSERIIVSDRQNGLFLFDFNREALSTFIGEIVSIHPNPSSSGNFTIKLNSSNITQFSYQIFDVNGRELSSESKINYNYTSTNINLAQGTYFIRINYTNYLGESVFETRKTIVN